MYQKKHRSTSIVWKINLHYQMQQFWRIIMSELLLFGVSVFLFAAACETQYGVPLEKADRSVTFSEEVQTEGLNADPVMEKLDRMEYRFTGRDGQRHVVRAGFFAVTLSAILEFLLVFRLIAWCVSWILENGRLRIYLKPIDELALAAERLSAGHLGEEQLQRLEASLDQIQGSDARISVGDNDLQGLENAINNLLTRLQKSYREQTRFVDDASHELRTPVAVIQGYASMLERWGKEDPKTCEEGIHAIREETDHMKTLIDQLLFLARGDMGRTKPEFVSMDVREVLKEIREESEMIDTSHEYVLQAEEAVPMYGEPALVKQAVRILTDNAAKYTPEGGQILFRAGKDRNGNVIVEVQDQGIGIDQKDMEHIFERFYRSDEVRGNTQGSGLGLSIAKWIIDKHDGKIEVFSVKSMGTRFRITIPDLSLVSED